MQNNERFSNIPKERDYLITLLGNGAANPIIQVGAQRITVTFVATGRYLVTWLDPPGKLIGFGGDFGDTTTQANVKGFTVTRGPIVVTAGFATCEVDVWNSAFAATNLAATNLLDLEFNFTELTAAGAVV